MGREMEKVFTNFASTIDSFVGSQMNDVLENDSFRKAY